MAAHPLGVVFSGLAFVSAAAAAVAVAGSPAAEPAAETAAEPADARLMRFEELDRMRLDCATGAGAACYELAREYKTRKDYWGQPVPGDGLKRDDKKAVYFFRKSCDLGVKEGCKELARMYEAGKGGAR